MKRNLQLTSEEAEAVERLGRRARLARLRRNLSQAEMAERIGVSRKTYVALEAGAATVSLAVLVKALSAFGYPERVAAILESDPIGEDYEEFSGRKRAGGALGVADF